MVKVKFESEGKEDEIIADGVFAATVTGENNIRIANICSGDFNKFCVMVALAKLVKVTIGALHKECPEGGNENMLMSIFLKLLQEEIIGDSEEGE